MLWSFRGGSLVNDRLKPSQRFLKAVEAQERDEETLEPTEALVDTYEAQTYKGGAVFKLPRPKWLVKGLLVEDSLACIYGQKGQGKTHYTLALALEIARGGVWNGVQIKPTPVFYLVGEGSSSVVERLEAWEELHKEKLPELFETGHIQPAPQLMSEIQVSALVKLLQRRQYQRGAFFLDTFQTATVGLDEINGADMGIVIESLKRIGRETKTTPIFVHHAGKNLERGQRGHSSLGASVETEIEIRRDSSGLVIAKLAKMRVAPDGTEFNYKLEKVSLEPIYDEDEELQERRSLVVLVPTDIPAPKYKDRPLRVLLEMLTGYDLADGYKRKSVEKLLGVGESSAGSLLKELKEGKLVTNLSPFTNKTNSSSYWLTDEGRESAKAYEAKQVSTKISETLNESEAF